MNAIKLPVAAGVFVASLVVASWPVSRLIRSSYGGFPAAAAADERPSIAPAISPPPTSTGLRPWDAGTTQYNNRPNGVVEAEDWDWTGWGAGPATPMPTDELWTSR